MNRTYLRILKEAIQLQLNDSDKGFKTVKTCDNSKCPKFEIEVDNVKCPACGKSLHPVSRRGIDLPDAAEKVTFDKTKLSNKKPLDVKKFPAYKAGIHKKHS